MSVHFVLVNNNVTEKVNIIACSISVHLKSLSADGDNLALIVRWHVTMSYETSRDTTGRCVVENPEQAIRQTGVDLSQVD